MGMTFIGVGAEGVKTALESAALIYAQDSGTGRKYIQSGARYGAARKGAPVFMNLRISSQPIRNSSELTERDVLAFFNEKFLSRPDPEGICGRPEGKRSPGDQHY